MASLSDIFGNAKGLKGLLSDEEIGSVQGDSLLQASLALMAAGGPSASPVSFGQALSNAYGKGREAFKGGIESQVGNLLTAQKVKEAQRQQAITSNRQRILADADPAKLNQAFAAALQSGDIELAKTLGDQIKASRQVLKPGEMLYEGNEVVAQGAPDPEKIPRYTGAYANLALSMFGTNRIDQLDPNQRMALDKEAQRRQLERPPSNVVNIGAPEKAFDVETAKNNAKLFNDLVVTGSDAASNINSLNQLGSLIERSGSGPGTAFRAMAGRYGIKLGKDAGDIEAANAVINRLVPAQRPAGSGTMSDKDVELFKSSLPNLMNTPEGNRTIVKTLKSIANYDIERARIADMAMNREITPQQARKMLMSLENPLGNFSADGSNAMSDDDLLRKYGVKK
jgi:hypothetical protein